MIPIVEAMLPIVQKEIAKGRVSFPWATVTSVNPLRIRLDRDQEPLPYAPDSLTSGLTVGARVQCLQADGRLTIIGINGGGAEPASQGGFEQTSTGTFPHGESRTIASITFDRPFASIPAVTLTLTNSTSYVLRHANRSPTGFNVIAQNHHVNGFSLNGDVNFDWTAVPTSRMPD